MLNYFLCCQESIEEGENIWFSAYTHNGLYQINKKAKEVRRMAIFTGEEGTVLMLYKAVVRIDEWLVFVPCAAKEIAVYNYKRNQLKKISLREISARHKVEYQEGYKFWTAVPYQNYVYLFGLRYPAILRLNPGTGETVYYTQWLEELEEEIKEISNQPGYWADKIVRGKYVYLPCMCAGMIFKFNLDKETAEIIKIESSVEGFFGIEDDGVNLWLVPWKSQNVIKWNPENGETTEISIVYRRKKEFPFQKPLLIEKKLYLFPYNKTEDVYEIDIEREKSVRCNELSNKYDIEKKDYSTGYITALNLQYRGKGIITYIHGRDYSWRVYNIKTGEESIVYWKVRGEEQDYVRYLYLNDKIAENNILLENQDETLSAFIRCLGCKYDVGKICIYDNRIGEKIYKAISNELF